jgi:hypothetical protein
MKNGFHSATALHGSARLPFVIPSEAEGSALQRTSRGYVFSTEDPSAFGPPKEMKNSFYSATALHESAALPFVIPSEAEGSAVQQASAGNVFDRGIMGLRPTEGDKKHFHERPAKLQIPRLRS